MRDHFINVGFIYVLDVCRRELKRGGRDLGRGEERRGEERGDGDAEQYMQKVKEEEDKAEEPSKELALQVRVFEEHMDADDAEMGKVEGTLKLRLEYLKIDEGQLQNS